MHMRDESGNEGATKEHLYLIKTSDVQLSIYWIQAAEEGQNYVLWNVTRQITKLENVFIFVFCLK